MKQTVLFILILSLVMMGGSSFAGDLEVKGKLFAWDLVPGLGTGDPYRYIRFTDGTTSWGGFMWNNTSQDYGDGDDFTIYTYGNRDIVLQPFGGKVVLSTHSGSNIGIGTKTPEHKLDVIGTIQGSHVTVKSNLISGGQNSWVFQSPDSGQNYLAIAPGVDGANWDWTKTTYFYNDGRSVFPGNMGIGGNPGTDNRLYSNFYQSDEQYGRAAYLRNEATATVDGTYYSQGVTAVVTPIVNTGVTNSGYAIALDASPLYTSSESGTLQSQQGMRLFYGNYDNCGGTCGAATINDARGLNIIPKHDNGVINNSYAIVINEPSTGAQVGNYYGMYQLGANTKNYFAGKVGIGTAAPQSTLDVAGDANVSGRVTSHKTMQAGVEPIDGSGGWQTVTFSAPFDIVPVVTATYNGGGVYAAVRNVSATSFQFKAKNADGTANTNTSNSINWIAMAATQ